jgi:hypothetical protein
LREGLGGVAKNELAGGSDASRLKKIGGCKDQRHHARNSSELFTSFLELLEEPLLSFHDYAQIVIISEAEQLQRPKESPTVDGDVPKPFDLSTLP